MHSLGKFPLTCKKFEASGLVVGHLHGNDICSALGITATASSPVLALCRKLIAAGYDPATPLNVYRGKTLALRILGIGEAAGLEIAGDGAGFRPRLKPGRASPMRQIVREAAE